MVGSATGNAGKETAGRKAVWEAEDRRSGPGKSSGCKEAGEAAGCLSLYPAPCPGDTNPGEPDKDGWKWGEGHIPADVHRRGSRKERGRGHLCDNELAEGFLCA